MCHHYYQVPFVIRNLFGTTFFLLSIAVAVVACYQLPDNPFTKMRAWHCHGRSQRDLVDRLRQANIIRTSAVQRVMEQVDRKNYIGENYIGDDATAYQDTPLAIGKQQTISAPHMHAHVLEEMWPAVHRADSKNQKKGPVKILDIGCGSGYLTACLGRFIQPKEECDDTTATTTTPETPLLSSGRVFGLDIHPELVQFTRDNIRKQDGDLLDSGVITLKHGNGWLGWPDQAPFDAIHVGAAAATFPTELALQLALHGVLIVPVGATSSPQTLLKVERIHPSNPDKQFEWDDFQVTQLLGVRYVPLVERPN